MKVRQEDIREYIINNIDFTIQEIIEQLYTIYDELNENEKYVIQKLATFLYNEIKEKETIFQRRREKLQTLKQLELPEQRSKEWYEMRKEKLTASALASALDKCHFTTRDELILSKIEDKPYESNPITEWGVKYEDIAIAFYEELYNVKVLDFGLIPHPEFNAFGASPDGICDDTGNKEYIARMVEIKCPPKRKFTKTVPPHYLMQVQGQLEVCDLDECDFFQVKIEDYDSYEDYQKDIFVNDDKIIPGRTNLNFPKGVTITYCKKDELKLSYLYAKLGLTDEEYNLWIYENSSILESNNSTIIEVKWWKISRYECTLVHRNHQWWIDNIEHILHFYNDLLFYKNNPENIQQLKDKITKKGKRVKTKVIPLEDFMLLSDEEDN
tara:strand:+ start:12141 stop:13289 length:1149 start_codon:yes stop_codon:yes gene_type:complete